MSLAPIMATFIVSVVGAFVLGGVVAVWLSWRIIESLVRQDSEARGYHQARAEANAEAVGVSLGIIDLKSERERRRKWR